MNNEVLTNYLEADAQLDALELAEQYIVQGEHPEFTSQMWLKSGVLTGYWRWVKEKLMEFVG